MRTVSLNRWLTLFPILIGGILRLPFSSSSELLSQAWFIPTRLTARIPCLDKSKLRPGRSMEQMHSGTALYRWVQPDGSIVGSGFFQTLRLLRMPANHSEAFYKIRLECLLFDWNSDSTVTSVHDISFYEGPTLTSTVSLGFIYGKNFTEFVEYLGRVDFVRDWCIKHPRCIEAVVSPVRSPELEYPHLLELAAAFKKTPLTDLQKDLKTAAKTGKAPYYLFHVNFVLRMSLSNELPDLCDPRLTLCAQRLLEGRRMALLQFGEASVETLDNFAEDRATVRKLRMPKQNLADSPIDALNYSLRIYSASICPRGYGPANLTDMRLQQSYEHNGSAVVCLACPPGTVGTNGLNCFDVPNDHYTVAWGQVKPTPCPDLFVTHRAGSFSKDNCTFNGTLLEFLVVEVLRLAWTEIENVANGNKPGTPAFVLMVYVMISVYSLYWQVHRLITILQYKARRDMSDRLLKRFIAEAFLRDTRRLQYWQSTIEAAKSGLEEAELDDSDSNSP